MNNHYPIGTKTQPYYKQSSIPEVYILLHWAETSGAAKWLKKVFKVCKFELRLIVSPTGNKTASN
jgi:hypothetical protein